ncbi:regulatory protein [Ophiostoma piceae UAMH 11346]|uniref:Regulatory protein n=1 Tax=Ophiostoma piceae (strain UAMH 11346) TaxID=1262450 RepID=S3D684_OPHP1|nr:regulatory protein [Ophiostoma piceae UAMH 11346]
MPRKTTGCWTCRARKKKCDDGRPSCAACLMRQIECYGYEEKPSWMDGGEVERSMLRSMKQRAKESYSQRRRSRAMKPRDATAEVAHSEHEVTAATVSPSTAPIHTVAESYMRSNHGSTSATQSPHSSRGSRHDGQESRQQTVGRRADDGTQSSRCDGQASHTQNTPYLPPPPYASYSSFPPQAHTQAHSAPRPYVHRHFTDTASSSSYASRPRSPPPPQLQFQQPLPPPQLPYSISQPLPPIQPAPRLERDSFPYSETELSLLMYYFDHVFHRICPFFIYSAGDKGRGWLLSLFLRTRPLCAAAICISACDQAQFVLGPLSDAPQPYHDLEMKHIHIVRDLRAHLAHLSQQAGVSRMPAAVEALACIMHLIYFEGTETDWVAHMDAAAALLSSLDTTMSKETPSVDSPVSSVQSTSSSTPCSNAIQTTIEDFFSVQFLSDSEKSAFDFFLAQYTGFFVISAISLDLTPQSTESVERTRAIFHRHQTKLKDIFGIEDWVMVTMLDIAVLKAWKQRERAKGTLSLKELARRADAIEDRIVQGLADLARRKPVSLPPGPFSASGPSEPNAWVPRRQTPPNLPLPTREEKIYMVTSTHLNAALLLLHIVVSGFYPNLQEIRRGVIETLEALEYMREHCDININSWPMCVAGCLALESEYPRFRALLPPPRTGQHPLVLTEWTLNIIERCWESRAAQPSQTDEAVSWVAAMNDLGTRLLLI